MDYETQAMSPQQIRDFKSWFNENIGTDFEVNFNEDENTGYVICFELTPNEVKKVQQYENA